MILLTLRDLQYRAVRFALVVVGTSLVFALLLLMTGLVEQFHLEPGRTVDAIDADAWILPKGVSGPFTSASTLDPSVAGALTGVKRADPLIVARNHLWQEGKPHAVVIIGHVIAGVGTPPVVSGKPASKSGEIAADETTGLEVGERVRVGSSHHTVSGLTRSTTVLAGLPLVFMPLSDAQGLVFRGQPTASAVVTRGRPVFVPEGFIALSGEDVADDARQPLEQAVSSVNMIRVLLWIVAAMILAGIVYLSSMERRRDFAVLKAVGANTRDLLMGLALQSVMIALSSAVVASGLQAVMAPLFPLKVEVSMRALIQLPLIAVVVAVVASIGGMRQVARTDPALVFSGTG